MNTLNITKLRAKAKNLKPVVRIGKSGITDGVLREIKLQLGKKGLIKIKLLKSFVKDRAFKKRVIDELLKKTNATLIQDIGSIIALYKKKKLYK